MLAHSRAPSTNSQLAAGDDLVGVVQPRVMGVDIVSEVRNRGGNVGHCQQRDAEVRVGMHAHADAEGGADPSKLDRGPQPSPVVMIAEDDLDRIPVGPNRECGRRR